MIEIYPANAYGQIVIQVNNIPQFDCTCTQEGDILRLHFPNCDKMANQLTHGLMAAAFMALINPLFGMDPVSWNIFLAGMVGMLTNIDCSDCRIFKGSPVGHSLGFCMAITYLAGIVAYFGYAFAGWNLFSGMVIMLAIGTGIFTHLAAEYFSGQQIFTLPNNMRPGSWLRKVDASSDKFWASWNRTGLKGSGLKDSQLNGISLAVLLFSIGIF